MSCKIERWKKRNKETMSSQKSKLAKLKSEINMSTLLKAQGIGLAIGAGFFFLGDSSIWSSVAVAVAWCAGVLAADWQRQKIKRLEDQIESFPAEEFLHGMNEFGVETLMGGGGPFGPQADIRLRFPATQLHKHLVDAMVHGYTAAYIREEAPLSTEEVEEIHNQVDRLAWRWIEEMTKGLR